MSFDFMRIGACELFVPSKSNSESQPDADRVWLAVPQATEWQRIGN